MSTALLSPYLVYHDFLSGDEHAAILNWALEHEKDFLPTTLSVGKLSKVDPERRVSSSTLDLGPSATVLSERLWAMVPGLIEALKVTSFTIGKIDLELVAHQDGAFLAPHLDTYFGRDRGEKPVRMLSGVYYFHREPKRFSGGALRLLPLSMIGDGVDVQPVQNSLVVFPSWVPHEVRQISCPSNLFADARFAVNCWVHRK